MAYDEIQNLILNVQGRDQVDQLRQALEKEEATLRESIKLFGENSVQAQTFATSTIQLQQQLKQTEALLKTTSSNTAGYRQASMAASYAIQDFTSANGGLVQQLNSVSNNIPAIIAGLGGPGMSGGMVAGLVAFSTITIAAAPHVVRLVEKLELFGDKSLEVRDRVEKLKDRIAELENMKIRPNVDTAELDNLRFKLKQLQDAKQAFEQFRGTRSEADRRAGEETEQLIAMAPGGARNLSERLARSMAEQMIANDPRLQDFTKRAAEATTRASNLRGAAASAMASGTPGAASQFEGQAEAVEKELKTLNAAIEAQKRAIRGDDSTGTLGTAHEAVGAMFKGVTSGTDPGARQNLVRQLQRIGEQQLAAEIAATNTRAMAAAKDEEDAEEAVKTKQEDHKFRQQLHKRVRQNAEKEAEQAVHDAAAIDAENLKASKEADRQRAAHAREFAKAHPPLKSVAEQIKAEDLSIKAGGIDVMAERLLAQATTARNQGVQGFKGKSDDQIFDMVQREVQKYLHRQTGFDQFGRPVHANRGMGREETGDIATKITSQASTQLQKDMLGMNATGLNNTGRLISITNQLTGQLQRQAALAAQQSRTIDQLANQAAQVGQTRLNRRGR